MKPGILAFITLLATWSTAGVASESDKELIREVVSSAYVHGAFNEQNTDAMRKGFDPSFAIHGADNGELRKFPLDQWIDRIEEGKAAPDYQRQTWTHKLPIIDVTGDAAVVKIELFHDGKHVYTDYLSLLKLEGGWTITDKVYFRHGD